MGFLSTVLNIFLAILILLFMITVHEFGHYIVGKIFKFKINEFAGKQFAQVEIVEFETKIATNRSRRRNF